MTSVLQSLPILILNPFSRCNCRCRMCDIWRKTEPDVLNRHTLEHHLDSLRGFDLRWVVLSGGEPLMHPDLVGICAALRARSLRVTVLTTGLLLERYARELTGHVDDLIVSLDGPPATHDSIRRVDNAFCKLTAGIRAARAVRPELPIAARCTVQRSNHAHLRGTVATARDLGLNSISFLAADVQSAAFNRPGGWPAERKDEVALTAEQIPYLEAEVEGLIAEGDCAGFVRETPEKLRRIVTHFRALLGLTQVLAPRCNAPWVSAVIEADGVVRPCFFHPPIGKIDGGRTLKSVINGAEAVAFRSNLDVGQNPICRGCVCSLFYEPPSSDAVSPPAASL